MNRRGFLAAMAAARSLPVRAESKPPVISGRPAGLYQDVLNRLEPEADEFACEREARLIEVHLSKLLQLRSLPLAPSFKAVSPLPAEYESITSEIQEATYSSSEQPAAAWEAGLRKWIEALGHVRYSRFYALASGLIRFEIAGHSEYRTGYWRQTWRDNQLVEFTPVSETLVRGQAPLFTDATSHCFGREASFIQQLLPGNPWWRARLDAASGIDVYGNNGIAVADVDNDGQDEIYVCQPGGLPNRLYRNRGDGTFEDLTERSGLGVLDDTTSALFVDFRNCGVQDLVVLRSSGPVYFRNDGHGRFIPRPDAFRFRTSPQGSFTGMAAADYDRDGKVDLYLCCYVYFQSEDQYRYPAPYHDAQNGPPNFLFRNGLDGESGGFEDVTETVGLNQNNNRFSFAPAWCDYNGDGWPDLYVANDFGRNNLYRNTKGRFSDVAAEAGVEDIGPGMSAAWFDYDGDGRPDLYVSNMWTAPGQRMMHDAAFRPAAKVPEAYNGHTKGNSLFRNRGDGTFEQIDAREGAAIGGWAWSSGGFDFDNDGSPEILVAAGMLTNSSDADLESFFWRRVVAESPDRAEYAPKYENGWNAINELIREDYSWCGGQRNVFYKRAGGRFIDFSGISGFDIAADTRTFAVTDVDADGNLDLILKNRLGPQVRVLRNNSGAGRPVVAFRLRGTESNRDAIGARVEFDGQVQFLAAGSGFLSQHSKTIHFAAINRTSSVSILWPSGAVERHDEIEPGFCYQITEGSADVKKAAFRARAEWKSPPIEGKNRPEPADVWLLEAVPTPEPVEQSGFLVVYSGARPALPQGVPVTVVDLSRKPRDTAAQFAVLRRYLLEYRRDLELPVTLLVDSESRVHKFYSRVPDSQVARSDWRRLENPERISVALPFTGFYFRQPLRNYFKLGAAFYYAGYPDRAIPYLKEEIRRNPQSWKALNTAARIWLDTGSPAEARKAYGQVLTMRPGYPAALLGAGEAAMALNQWEEAERMFTAAQEHARADAANQFGLLRVKQNRFPDAKRYFERAIEAQRDHSGAINNLGVLYMQIGQPGDAIAAFEFGIRQAPDDEQLYMNLGRVYVASGQMERARDTMQRLLARKPGNAAAEHALRQLSSR